MPARSSPLAAILLLGFGFTLFAAGALGWLVVNAIGPTIDSNQDAHRGFAFAGLGISIVLTLLGAVAFGRFWTHSQDA